MNAEMLINIRYVAEDWAEGIFQDKFTLSQQNLNMQVGTYLVTEMILSNQLSLTNVLHSCIYVIQVYDSK